MLHLDLSALRKLATRSKFYAALPSEALQKRWREVDEILNSAEGLDGCLGCTKLTMFYLPLAGHLANELSNATQETVINFKQFVLENLSSTHTKIVLYYRSGSKALSLQI